MRKYHAPFWNSGRRSDPPIDCTLSGLKALSISTVLWLTFWWSLYRKSRAGGTHFIRRGATTGCMDVSYPSR
jgi:hypothetical protein